MQFRRFHQTIANAFNDKRSKEIAQVLDREGYIPLESKVLDYLSSEFPLIKDEFKAGQLLAVPSELFLNAESETLVAYIDPRKSPRTTRSGRKDTVDLLIGARDEDGLAHAESVVQTFSSQFGDTAPLHGSVLENQLVQTLNEALKKPSPNGRKLSDEDFLSNCRALANDELRADLQTVVRTFENAPVRREIVAKLDAFASRSDELDALLSNDQVIDTVYSAQCSNCRTSNMIYRDSLICEQLVAAEPECPECKRSSFEVVELYQCKPFVADGLQQGLWLEALALDSVKRRTEKVWAGQMAGQDEVDAIAVYADRIVLLECKDTSFGQNEFYVARAKAENVDAMEICIITTRDVHPNVTEAVKRANENRDSFYRRSSRHFEVISDKSAVSISDQLDAVLDRLDRRVHREWFGGGAFQHLIYSWD